MMSCLEAMGWEFGNFEKEVSWDLTMGRAGPGQSSWGLRPWSSADPYWQRSWGLRDAQHVFWVREYSQHSKNCVSISSCRKTKVKKLINVSYLNDRESSVFRISLHQYMLHSGFFQTSPNFLLFDLVEHKVALIENEVKIK